MKKKYKRKILTASIILILVITVIYLLFNKQENVYQAMTLNFENRTDNLANYHYEDYLIVGWLQVQGTNIDYPILNHDASLIDPNQTNYGWRSPYYTSGENREVLIGHNIINVSSTPSRDMSILNNFEGLMAFTYDDFAEENLYISYTKGNINGLYKIYAVGFYDYYDDNAESFSNSQDIKKYIEKVRKNSLYDYDVDVTEEDQIITIKTCTRYFGLFEKQEFYVDARKVRENEKIVKYKVTKNDNYNILSEGSSKENG